MNLILVAEYYQLKHVKDGAVKCLIVITASQNTVNSWQAVRVFVGRPQSSSWYWR